MKPKQLFELARNDKCLCGSNKKYKKCCLHIHEHYNNLEDTKKYIAEENYVDALITSNADLSKYLINIKRHTEHLLELNNPFGKELLEIDLKALEEILYEIYFIHKKLDSEFDFEEKFIFLENIINIESYFELIRFFRILFLPYCAEKSEEIVVLLRELCFEKLTNVKLLELCCLHVSNELERSMKHRLFDRLIELEDDDLLKLKFLSMKSLDLYLNKEIEYSRQCNDLVRKKLTELFNHGYSDHSQYIVANASYFSGVIGEDNQLIERSIIEFEKLLSIEQQVSSVSVLANTYNAIGEAYLILEKFELAIVEFTKGIDIYDNHLGHINIARAYISLGSYDLAMDKIKLLSINEVPNANVLDYLITAGRIIVEIGDVEFANVIYDSLREYETNDLLFNDYKVEILMQLLVEFKGFSDSTNMSTFREKLLEWNKVIDLKPNIFGLGIDINAIIKKILNSEA